ncbi:S1C family serine protease [Cellulomonas hominis]|uniref:S1C family serine protease n=1 Tax=Cellulomonas hominis TaxID=156981 RepID=UPI0027E09AB7|nr:trypsin-like peptidase domain-containing protein [Cellulomonas hominis]
MTGPVEPRPDAGGPAYPNPFAAPGGPAARAADPFAAPAPAPQGWTAPPAVPASAVPATGPVAEGAPLRTAPLPPAPLPADPGAAPAPALLPSGAPAWPDLAPPAAPARRRRARLPLGVVAGLVVAAFGAGLLGGLVGARVSDGDDRLVDAGLPAAVGTGAGDRAPDSVAGIAATVLPSVVSIESTTAAGSSTGSGLVLRQDGYILTNHHVVAGADEAGATLVVLFADGSQEAATVVGSTPDYDLAVLKVEVTGLTPLALGDSDQVQVGDPVVAVGAPLGLAGTVTSGIVSALNRPVAAGDGGDATAFINAIQTDAAINPGNSGGPLVNAAGEVVGINSAIAQPPGAAVTGGGSIGLGFAIPSNQARRTAEQLIETGRATYPVIGAMLDTRYTGEGVRVAEESQQGQQPVTPDGPADRAGIRPGDVILAIEGRPVTQPDELIVAIRARTPGEAVLLRVRGAEGAERDVRVVLDESAQG